MSEIIIGFEAFELLRKERIRWLLEELPHIQKRNIIKNILRNGDIRHEVTRQLRSRPEKGRGKEIILRELERCWGDF